MFTPSVSLFSVQWDLRSIWASMDLISKAYFLALLGSTVFIGLSAAPILWAIRQSKPERNQNTKADWQRLSIRLHNGFRFFFLLFLVFGVAVANAVFVGLRAVHYSYSSPSEYPSVGCTRIADCFLLCLVVHFCLPLLPLMVYRDQNSEDEPAGRHFLNYLKPTAHSENAFESPAILPTPA